jgi:pilus assembly protein CpaE
MSEGENIRILIVDDVAETRETIRKLLQFESDLEVVGAARSGHEAIDLAKETKPDVILMDINMPDMDGITATENIRRDVPFAQIIILSIQSDPNYMRRAMLAGARDFLTKPPMINEMTAAIRRAGNLAQEERTKSRHSFVTQPGMNGGGMAGLVDANGKVIAVYSPKGGTGCTTVATNLAVTLKKLEETVILVDGNMQFGDISVFLNQQSKNSVGDLAPRADELDPEIIEEVVVEHQASGMKVLAAPARPEYGENVNGEAFGKVLEYLRHLYTYVIVDTASALTDVTLAVIDQADAIVLITTQDIPAIKNARLFFDLLGALEISRQRVVFVMNRFDKRIGITPEKVGESFKHEVAAVLPLEERVVVPSINRGVPFMLNDKSKPLERSFQMLAEVVRQRVSPEGEALAGAENSKNGKR